MKTKDAPRGIPDGEFDEIHRAARNRDASKVRELIGLGVDPNLRNKRSPNGDGDNTPLWFAAQGPKVNGREVAKVLIDAGADVNAVCEHGTTAAHLACSWGHEDVLQLLYENGADFTMKDVDGMTPELTARHGYEWQLKRVTDQERSGVIRFFDDLRKT